MSHLNTVENVDIVHAAVAAQRPHDHEMNPFKDVCDACGRTTLEIINNRLRCDALLNHKPLLPPW